MAEGVFLVGVDMPVSLATRLPHPQGLHRQTAAVVLSIALVS
eukprot:COSAG06_NODE_60049_length_272_cov_0.601156_1_plen_41_part_01